ncbi:hypothetical protein [Streptomyces sp. EKS3.2]|uniref:hypothetical protein n=1 Tax=Streptomyces sp. EKS3.2 TaxID=3461008 RepID=UPI004043558C
MKIRHHLMAAAAVILGVLAVTGCSTDTRPSGTPADTTRTRPTLTADDATPAEAEVEVTPDIEEHTRDTFALTWAGADETERNAYCMSVLMLPPDQAAASMQRGADGDTSLDWDLMVQLLEQQCLTR